jgi:hypothetical protein
MVMCVPAAGPPADGDLEIRAGGFKILPQIFFHSAA